MNGEGPETSSWPGDGLGGVTTLASWDQGLGRGRGFAPGRGRGFGKWANTEEKPVGLSRNNKETITNGRKLGQDSDKNCFRCKEVGHLSRDCPTNGGKGPRITQEVGGGGQAEMWGAVNMGHKDNSGPLRSKPTTGCYKCGEEGHISRDCPGEGEGRRGQGEGCYNCGGSGHFARECRGGGGDRRQNRSTEGPVGRGELYIPDESLEENLYEHGVNSGINFSKYENIPVKVTGEDVPDKMDTFAEGGLNSLVRENINRSKYKAPTPVQKYAIPMILQDRDVMGCAQTGSGKTAAFLIPIVNKLLQKGATSHRKGSGPVCPEVVIMSPTRELAIQIKDEARKFCAGSGLRCVVAYGGTSVVHQSSILAEGCNILVATPGRLFDFVEKNKVCYQHVQYLVLDEADRMLDMGFKEDIIRMVRNPDMPGKGTRQTLMFSATYPPEIQKMAFEFMTNYLFLAVGMVGGACSDVVQDIVQVAQYDKRERLLETLRENEDMTKGVSKTLVFVETKKTADFLASYMCQSQLAATSIHGDRLQREREEALKDFKQNRKPVLVATAVAARGLDIKGISHVINYDLPKNIEEYVHRIGRTGRLGNLGRATSFFDNQQDSGLAHDLVKILAESHQTVPNWLQDEARRNPEGQGGLGGSRFGAKDIRTGPGFVPSNQPVEGDERWDQ